MAANVRHGEAPNHRVSWCRSRASDQSWVFSLRELFVTRRGRCSGRLVGSATCAREATGWGGGGGEAPEGCLQGCPGTHTDFQQCGYSLIIIHTLSHQCGRAKCIILVGTPSIIKEYLRKILLCQPPFLLHLDDIYRVSHKLFGMESNLPIPLHHTGKERRR